MRNIVFGCWIVACLLIGGCGFMDYMAGVKYDENGKVVQTQGGVAEIGLGLLAATGGASGLAGGIGGWVLKAYRHKRIIDSGGKDDDFDGKPDPEPPKEVKTAV